MTKQKKPLQVKSSGTLKQLKCTCGSGILILPDAKEMGLAIDAHAIAHGILEQDPKQAKAITEHIRELLIIQLFKKIGQTKQPASEKCGKCLYGYFSDLSLNENT